ncbi:MAG TPA: substrate-binding domain-containing protein [bacterium]|nr:substrate-binding domain-containing protein [bacterium]HPR88001.1 substrate-binding domain-containing protein [bacterium]
MKNRIILRPLIFLAAAGLLLQAGCQRTEKGKVVIGFSQVTVKEPWRVVFNENLRIKAAEYNDRVEVIFLDADDKTENQVEHIKAFIAKRVDAILISPKEASGCSRAIQEATEAGIPVIVLDRDVTYKGYAAYVGADNERIGEAAGEEAVRILGGPGKARGKIYEICGSLASTPGQERRDGFHQIVGREPGIEILGGLDGDWKLDKAKAIAQDALQLHRDIDILYAHNDPMAYGAWQAAKELGLEKRIRFFGIDGLPQEGCMWVANNILAATFLYPTPGEKGLEIALEIIRGQRKIKPGEKIIIPSTTITRDNVNRFIQSNPDAKSAL